MCDEFEFIAYIQRRTKSCASYRRRYHEPPPVNTRKVPLKAVRPLRLCNYLHTFRRAICIIDVPTLTDRTTHDATIQPPDFVARTNEIRIDELPSLQDYREFERTSFISSKNSKEIALQLTSYNAFTAAFNADAKVWNETRSTAFLAHLDSFAAGESNSLNAGGHRFFADKIATERQFEEFVTTCRSLSTAVEALTNSNLPRVQFKRAVGEAGSSIEGIRQRYRNCLENLRQFEVEAGTYREQRLADAIAPSQRTNPGASESHLLSAPPPRKRNERSAGTTPSWDASLDHLFPGSTRRAQPLRLDPGSPASAQHGVNVIPTAMKSPPTFSPRGRADAPTSIVDSHISSTATDASREGVIDVLLNQQSPEQQQPPNLGGASQRERTSTASSFDSSWDPYGWNTHEAQSPRQDDSPSPDAASSSLNESSQTPQPLRRPGPRQSQAAEPIAPTREGHSRSAEQALLNASDPKAPNPSKGRRSGHF